MKITKTGFHMDVNHGSSYKIYIFRDSNDPNIRIMYDTLMTVQCYDEHDGIFWHVSGGPADDCRVPEFFKGRGYYMICVEHNRGDWNKPFTYELYIVE